MYFPFSRIFFFVSFSLRKISDICIREFLFFSTHKKNLSFLRFSFFHEKLKISSFTFTLDFSFFYINLCIFSLHFRLHLALKFSILKTLFSLRFFYDFLAWLKIELRKVSIHDECIRISPANCRQKKENFRLGAERTFFYTFFLTHTHTQNPTKKEKQETFQFFTFLISLHNFFFQFSLSLSLSHFLMLLWIFREFFQEFSDSNFNFQLKKLWRKWDFTLFQLRFLSGRIFDTFGKLFQLLDCFCFTQRYDKESEKRGKSSFSLTEIFICSRRKPTELLCVLCSSMNYVDKRETRLRMAFWGCSMHTLGKSTKKRKQAEYVQENDFIKFREKTESFFFAA